MEQNTSYRYEANSEDSYNSLAAYASTIPATVTLHPGLLTIVISGNAANEVGKFIDDNGLDFHISQVEVDDDNLNDVIYCETTDADTLRKIIYRMMEERKLSAKRHEDEVEALETRLGVCESSLRDVQGSRDNYCKWWTKSSSELNRVKRQIEAIAVLYESIFPKE